MNLFPQLDRDDRIRLLLVTQSDLDMAWSSAEHFLEVPDHDVWSRMRYTLVCGMCYARPFVTGTQKLPRLPDWTVGVTSTPTTTGRRVDGAYQALRDVHERLIALRRSSLGHSDVDARGVLHRAESSGTEYVRTGFHVFSDEVFQAISKLARHGSNTINGALRSHEGVGSKGLFKHQNVIREHVSSGALAFLAADDVEKFAWKKVSRQFIGPIDVVFTGNITEPDTRPTRGESN